MEKYILFFIVVSLHSAGIYSIYEGYSIKWKCGVVPESNSIYFVSMAFTIAIFNLTLPYYDRDLIIGFNLLLIVILFLATFYRFYYRGKTLTVYEARKEDLIYRIEKVLQEYGINYDVETHELDNENEQPYYTFHIKETGTKLQLEWDDERSTKFRVYFKKWWRIERSQEIYPYLLECLREGREDGSFFKASLSDYLLAILSLCSGAYFTYKLFSNIPLL